MAWCMGTVTLWPALPSSLKPSVAACLMMLKSGRVRPCEGYVWATAARVAAGAAALLETHFESWTTPLSLKSIDVDDVVRAHGVDERPGDVLGLLEAGAHARPRRRPGSATPCPRPPARRCRPSAPWTRTWPAVSAPSTRDREERVLLGEVERRVERARLLQRVGDAVEGGVAGRAWRTCSVTSLMRLFWTSSSTVVSTGAPSTMLARGSMRRMCASGAAPRGEGRAASKARPDAGRPRATGAGGAARGFCPNANVIVRSSGGGAQPVVAGPPLLLAQPRRARTGAAQASWWGARWARGPDLSRPPAMTTSARRR